MTLFYKLLLISKELVFGVQVQSAYYINYIIQNSNKHTVWDRNMKKDVPNVSTLKSFCVVDLNKIKI